LLGVGLPEFIMAVSGKREGDAYKKERRLFFVWGDGYLEFQVASYFMLTI
jgi:hypothetical protein